MQDAITDSNHCAPTPMKPVKPPKEKKTKETPPKEKRIGATKTPAKPKKSIAPKDTDKDKDKDTHTTESSNSRGLDIENAPVPGTTIRKARKPKAVKVFAVPYQAPQMPMKPEVSSRNVILFLKCKLKDLESQAATTASASSSFALTTEFEGVGMGIKVGVGVGVGSDLSSSIGANDVSSRTAYEYTPICTIPHTPASHTPHTPHPSTISIDSHDQMIPLNPVAVAKEHADIARKINQTKCELYGNSVDKSSACFWDTREFTGSPVYIPSYFMHDKYHVYGCFCSPECAAAYLMQEHIDSSTKFERLQLLQYLYAPVDGGAIHPAPDPRYMLDDFFGRLTIDEYRKLSQLGRVYTIVNKPMARIMPEIYDEREKIIVNSKTTL